MNFGQLLTLLSCPRVRYLKWEDSEVTKTYFELVSGYHTDHSDPDEELCTATNELVEKFKTQVKEKFDIEFTPVELGLAPDIEGVLRPEILLP
ncbi:MAG: hypothetical protein A2937_00910 [Candidatus Yonathbacteria bacterium RIFCSPLOWO2_01_FULL_47_33b]|uniref:Uncharacterized protein n=1 Tax=Candidatus Yonathbacteria bacterium RIFCSPLOWO2_01_FULL_47_33b TaxID=1802727 RepID=A0A1G2SFU4_9BACT|nr:MAG: hypothetical protein A2937_00910 [Candidatus Yonathbacteria bacterium RIFCSPLOWO2_01_FULL_47_33b]